MKSDPQRTPEPLRIDASTLYPVAWLRDRLDGVVSLGTLLDRLELRNQRIFKDAIWGWELLDAAKRAKPFSEASHSAAMVDFELPRGRAGRNRSNDPVRKLGAKDLED